MLECDLITGNDAGLPAQGGGAGYGALPALPAGQADHISGVTGVRSSFVLRRIKPQDRPALQPPGRDNPRPGRKSRGGQGLSSSSLCYQGHSRSAQPGALAPPGGGRLVMPSTWLTSCACNQPLCCSCSGFGSAQPAAAAHRSTPTALWAEIFPGSSLPVVEHPAITGASNDSITKYPSISSTLDSVPHRRGVRVSLLSVKSPEQPKLASSTEWRGRRWMICHLSPVGLLAGARYGKEKIRVHP